MWRLATIGFLYLAVACSGGGQHEIDAPPAALDGDVDGPGAVDARPDGRPGGDAGLDAAIDAGRAQCLPTGGCLLGPPCGNRCCGQGEHCEAGECRCGIRPACPTGQMCAAPGPIGGDACGSICCGNGVPCPL